MYCTHCGHHNPAPANFCANCGRPLAATSDATTGSMRLEEAFAEADANMGPDEPAVVAELDPRTALLAVVRGPNEGARFLLDRDVVTVGRHPDSDIFFDDITVSRRHAEFRREDEGFRVVDAGSLNGTYVNGQRTEEHLLDTGDEVQVGKFKLRVYVAEPVG
ncbi:FHA domain-containing protein [Egibacter rhizosphaerae]|uniref:FHA domain-containing protein n=1 Tax=Egibacter rhizosphaerae TaxID=1670831 RepID=A0A411YK84_9ACTN|nr:FHA domain-containing protein [Egibacter rhizosphaerae]QBI21605.1 FHA domain-containing protein [Egibacter rhizosphaerae]